MNYLFKKFMKKLYIIFFTIILSTNLYSQEYKYGFGARLGFSNGLSAKAFVYADESKYMAVEGIIGVRFGGYNFTGLFQVQKEFHIAGMRYATLYYYAGFGGHLGSYDPILYERAHLLPYSGANILSVGADGVAGLEYVFADFPVTVGIDFRPYIDLINPSVNFFDAGLTLRYCIKN